MPFDKLQELWKDFDFTMLNVTDHFTTKPKVGLLRHLCQGPCRVSILCFDLCGIDPLDKDHATNSFGGLSEVMVGWDQYRV